MSCINVSVKRIGGINVSVGVVCRVGIKKYLRVTPQDPQWIDVNFSADYNIESNTDWLVQ